jgi:hypothetical protein
MNTTTLIAEWSMQGARRDIAGRFRAIDDIRALLHRGGQAEPLPAPVSVLVKRAGEEDWRPLSTDE